MKKNIKKYNNKKQKIIIGIFSLGVIALLFLLLDLLLAIFLPVFKVESRLNNIKKSNEKYEEKVVGWLRVEGTNIDYPVIHNSDKTEVNSIKYDFGWTNENDEKLGNRELIFGHNLLNVSKNPLITDKNHKRFEQLMSFIYYDFANDNKYIQYTKNGVNYIYKIFSIGFISDENLDYYNNNFESLRLNNYIKEAKNNSLYDYKVNVNKNDKILSLVTCTRFYGADAFINFKIDARLVRKGENITNYKVTETKKYDKIKEEMKGDDENEKL